MEIASTSRTQPSGLQPPSARQEAMQAAAENMEAAFLSEMLKSAGLGAMKGDFGGGAGEDQFASLMRQEQARMMVEGGGIGLAEHLVRSMSVTP